MSETKRVLVWRGKHDSEYYDASTVEEWAQACLDVARELDGFEVYEEWELAEEPDVDIDSLPEAYQAGARETAKIIARRNAASREHNQDVAIVKAALATNSVALVTYNRGTPRERVEPALWEVLAKRAGYEYEDVSLETVRS